MSLRYWLPVVFILVFLIFLTGCGGHYKVSDDEYRVLGDLDSIRRGK